MAELLTVLFIGLKLTGYITWSWWWITAPMWGLYIAFPLFLIGVALFIAILVAVLEEIN